MRIQQNQLVPLGHGVWVRSDEIVAIEPIREKRGPGQRALVWVRGLSEPMIASRSEDSILRDLTQPRELVDRGRQLERVAEHVSQVIDRIPPVLLRVVAQETGQDLNVVAIEAKQALTDGKPSVRAARRNAGRPAGQSLLPEEAR